MKEGIWVVVGTSGRVLRGRGNQEVEQRYGRGGVACNKHTFWLLSIETKFFLAMWLGLFTVLQFHYNSMVMVIAYLLTKSILGNKFWKPGEGGG